MNSRKTILFFSGAIIAILVLLWVAYFLSMLSPASAQAAGNNPAIIGRGEGFRQIADQLEAAGLIRSASAFKLYGILTGSAHQLKPGLYNISAASSTSEIVSQLVAGPGTDVQVRIADGATLADVDAMLAKLGIIKAGSLIGADLKPLQQKYPFLYGARSLEGYIFPDTYRFFFNSTQEQAVRPFLDNFGAKVGPLISDGDKVDYDNIPITRRGIYSMHQIVTVASMLEKEVPGSADRALVADILYRRAKMGMPLQVDATVAYAQAHGEAYDTYKNPGLPPGPIASPSLDAINAALNPKSNQYLYYLSDPKTGKTIFAKTFDEHKANKAKYLQ